MSGSGSGVLLEDEGGHRRRSTADCAGLTARAAPRLSVPVSAATARCQGAPSVTYTAANAASADSAASHEYRGERRCRFVFGRAYRS